MLPANFSAFELQPLPDGASTILRLLAAQAPNWPEIALVAARDPALSLALLMAEPMGPGELQDGLNAALRRRLERIGTDLLRAWLLGLGHVATARTNPPTPRCCAPNARSIWRSRRPTRALTRPTSPACGSACHARRRG
jgi:hypothetical protein